MSPVNRSDTTEYSADINYVYTQRLPGSVRTSNQSGALPVTSLSQVWFMSA
jgi:hypothetical protein